MSLRLWEIVTDPFMKWDDFKTTISSAVTKLNFNRLTSNNTYTLYDIYIHHIGFNYNKAIIPEFYEYLDSLSSRVLRKLLIHGEVGDVVGIYIVSRYISGKIPPDTLELMIVDGNCYINAVLTGIIRSQLESGDDISELMEVIGDRDPVFDAIGAIIEHGREEHFVWMSELYYGSFHDYIIEILEAALVISIERLREVVGYIQHMYRRSASEVQVVTDYTEGNDDINSAIMSVLLESVSREEVAEHMKYNSELRDWMNNMKESQV